MKCHELLCNKKISLTNALICKCKCGKVFCIAHRQSENHICDYDHKQEINKEEYIEKNKCINSKIIKI
jgi:hypothetical protein